MTYTPGTHNISSIRAIVSICVLCTVGQYDVYSRYASHIYSIGPLYLSVCCVL